MTTDSNFAEPDYKNLRTILLQCQQPSIHHSLWQLANTLIRYIKCDTFYNIRYCATEEEYYQKDLKSFEEVFKCFKLVAAK